MIATKEEFIDALDNEIKEQERRLNDGWYLDDYIPGGILYDCPMEIVREVVRTHPKYLSHWPLLKDFIK